MIALLAKITNLLALDMGETMLISVCVCGVIGGIIGFVVARVGKKGKAKDTAQQPVEQQDTLSQEQEYLEANEIGEIVMSRNVIYSAGQDGQLKAGKYLLKAADSSADKFNVRYNGLVKEYVSGDVVTLTDGDTISPVSGSVVISIIEE